jgi:hypothetical protein
VEADLAEVDRLVRNQRAFLERGSEVAGLGIGDDGAVVAHRRETIADELVEAELLRTADLDDAVDRCPLTDLAHGGGDVVRGNRLEQHMR